MHVILWEFRVRPGHEREFEGAYGPASVWVEFFNRGEGYLGTELLRDMGAQGRYMTIDRWASKAAYETFRDAHLSEYEAIDRRCQALTESERPGGTFVPISSPVLE